MNTEATMCFIRPAPYALLAIIGMASTGCDTAGPTAGIEGTGVTETFATAVAVSRGPIESTDGRDVTVNGDTWSAADAKITIDGTEGVSLDLEAGMIVTLQGERTSANRARAAAIDARFLVRGPITGIDAATGKLEVLGQRIIRDQNTVVHIPGGSVDSLYVGQLLAVSGFLMPQGEIRATRISTNVPGSRPWIVTGNITLFDPSQTYFKINELTVSYPATLLAGLPVGTIEVGRSVVVFGSAFGADGALLASSIAPYMDTLPAIVSRDVVIAGNVYQVESDSVFSIAGQRIVRPPEVTIFAPIVAGMFVIVRGSLIDGVVYATYINVSVGGGVYHLEGQIEAIDVGAQTFRMLGLEFLSSRSLAGFDVGTWVWVRAGRDRFVQDVQPQAPAFGQRSGFGSPWFKSASPPISFTLDSLVDFTVLVTPTTRFFATYSFPDGECYGADRFSSEMFWPLTSEPSPGSTSSVSAYGRFEGGILIANDVWVCDPPRDRRWSEAEK